MNFRVNNTMNSPSFKGIFEIKDPKVIDRSGKVNLTAYSALHNIALDEYAKFAPDKDAIFIVGQPPYDKLINNRLTEMRLNFKYVAKEILPELVASNEFNLEIIKKALL